VHSARDPPIFDFSEKAQIFQNPRILTPLASAVVTPPKVANPLGKSIEPPQSIEIITQWVRVYPGLDKI
jgi:hypothetical protein